MAEFPRIGEEAVESPESAAEPGSEDQPKPEAKSDSSVVASPELVKLLEESAHALLNTFSYAAEMPPTNLFRALYPLPALEMIPSPVATLHELIRWLEGNAYSRIEATADLRFGDILIGFHFDQRAISAGHISSSPSDRIEHYETTGFDHLGVYLGRGLVAVPSPRRCGMTVISLLPSYAAAYRIVPGYAAAEYRLPMETIFEYANSCAGHFLLGEGEG